VATVVKAESITTAITSELVNALPYVLGLVGILLWLAVLMRLLKNFERGEWYEEDE